MREETTGVLMDGGRGGFKDDREAFPFLGGNGQRDRFAYVGGKLDGGIFEAAALTRTRAGRPVFLAWRATIRFSPLHIPKRLQPRVLCMLLL